MKERNNFSDNVFYSFFKKHKKIRLCTIVFGVCIGSFFLVNFGRYVKNVVNNHFLTTQKFYYNSNKLTSDNKQYVIDHWSGVEPYTINISLDSYSNNLLSADSDIKYSVTCTSDSKVDCRLSNNGNGTISVDKKSDSFEVDVSPKVGVNLQDGDEVSISLVATSTAPYVQTLSASFKFVIGSYGVTYKIEDKAGQVFLNSLITNAKDYYTATEAFGSYAKGDKISVSEYNALSNDDKAKCAGAIVTLSFDPSIVTLDLTNIAYLNKLNATYTDDGYVNSITFKVDPSSSAMVKFYKSDVTRNYSYPDNTSSTIVNFVNKNLE